MAGGDADCRARCPNLLSLYLARLQPPLSERSSHGNETAASAATEVVFTVRLHLHKIIGQIFDHLTPGSSQSTIAAYIAGILVGAAFTGKHRLVQFDSSFPQVLGK